LKGQKRRRLARCMPECCYHTPLDNNKTNLHG
jgi:hypothetical protein